jgi:hypothetical protein
MDFDAEPLSLAQLLVRLLIIALVIAGIVGIAILLTRRPVRDRIRASRPRDLLVWWSVPALVWAMGIFGGDAVFGWIEERSYVLGGAAILVWMLAMLLSPYAALIATGVWARGRFGTRTRERSARG